MRILVCGGRDYTDKEAVFSDLVPPMKIEQRIPLINECVGCENV